MSSDIILFPVMRGEVLSRPAKARPKLTDPILAPEAPGDRQPHRVVAPCTQSKSG